MQPCLPPAPAGRPAWRRRLPLLLLAGAMLLPLGLGALLVGNRLAGNTGRVTTYLERLQNAPLLGMQAHAPTPAWPVTGLLPGTWQAQFEAWWNSRLPLRTPVVRATNQALYSLLGTSYMYGNGLMVGRQQVLFERAYAQRYCNWDKLRFTATQFDAWADRIRAMQDLFTARGQRFVLLISPSKVAFAPQQLPAGTPCAGPHRPEYHLALAALARAQVRHVDGSALMARARTLYPAELLFVRGGTHWSALGGAVAAQELLRALQVPAIPPATVPLRYEITHNPVGADRDLLDMLNLRRPDTNYPVPRMQVTRQAAPAHQRPLRLATVGTSFMQSPLAYLLQSGQVADLDYYYYFSLGHISYVNGLKVGPEQMRPAADNYQALRTADLVVLETSEVHPDSMHLRLLAAHLGLLEDAPPGKGPSQ